MRKSYIKKYIKGIVKDLPNMKTREDWVEWMDSVLTFGGYDEERAWALLVVASEHLNLEELDET